MQPLRPFLLGLAVAAVTLIASAVLLTTIPKKASSGEVVPLRSGAVLSAAELETRTRKAEAELATARAQIQAGNFSNMLRNDAADYFALLGPLTLLAGSLLLGKASPLKLAIYASPVLATTLLLGAKVQALVLLAIALLVLLAINRRAPPTASDA